MARPLDYLYIVATIVFTVYGQVILKWRIGKLGALPPEALAKLKFLVMLLFDPAIFSGFAAAFLASLAWMAAMTRFEPQPCISLYEHELCHRGVAERLAPIRAVILATTHRCRLDRGRHCGRCTWLIHRSQSAYTRV